MPHRPLPVLFLLYGDEVSTGMLAFGLLWEWTVRMPGEKADLWLLQSQLVSDRGAELGLEWGSMESWRWGESV